MVFPITQVAIKLALYETYKCVKTILGRWDGLVSWKQSMKRDFVQMVLKSEESRIEQGNKN